MLITLTTDFGIADPFVGIMKGVIAGIDPAAQVVDISHGVPPQDLVAGALILQHSVPYFPQGTIHVAVVDPGVGSNRRALLIQCDGTYFIGPDNGVLSLALEGKDPTRIIQLSNPTYHLQPTSATFHGRDIFAPVAAHLSRGVAVDSLGETTNDFARIKWPAALRRGEKIDGKILYIDGFGNLFTNIRARDLQGFPDDKIIVALDSHRVRGLVSSYAAAPSGELLAIVNSWGLLEIALYKDSAERRTGAKVGDTVQLRLNS